MKGHWICSPGVHTSAAMDFVREWSPKGAVKKVTVTATAMGAYNFYVNSERVGDAFLSPGLTGYRNRVQSQTYDITDMIKQSNSLTFRVADGWCVGFIAYRKDEGSFADHTSLSAEIEAVYEDSSTEVFYTDTSWRVYSTPILSSRIYLGETVDLTASVNFCGFAALDGTVNTEIIKQQGETVREQERISPVETIKTPKGETVIDFGQNMTGYVEIKIKGKRGERIVLNHAEVLDKQGNFYTENLRSARNENIYVLSGGEDVFKPSFSFQGFRYVRLNEFPEVPLEAVCFTAIAVHSDMKRTGSFSCGNAKINQLYHNIIWGQKSNFLDIPTDCPQRDERLGWTGDAQVFCRTAAINYDVKRFFTKWLDDVMLEQKPDGAVLGIVPNVFFEEYSSRISAAWGDAACIIPWQLWQAYGDKELLRHHFPMMKRWVDYMHSAGDEEFLWLGGNHYGDWLAMDGDPDEYSGKTPTNFIACIFFAYSCSLTVAAGKILNEDVSKYEALYGDIVKAVRDRYVKDGRLVLYPNGQTACDLSDCPETQSGYVLMLFCDLFTEDERKYAAARLVEMIKEKGGIMTTGFVATPYILHVLSDNGYTDEAYKLLLQEKSPSWLYSVNHGATTMWEHWNSLKEDGSFWSADMNSFNHYAYGAVYDWIFGVAAGIKPDEKFGGYRVVHIAPQPCREIGFMNASIETKYGKITSNWYYKDNDVYYEIEIPEGVDAELTLPNGEKQALGKGCYRFASKGN